MRGLALFLLGGFMGWGKTFFLTLIISVSSMARTPNGLCTYEPASQGLPKALCSFPSCPVGSDCLPPTIDKFAAAIEYYEPLLQWKDTCPNQSIPNACWEVYIDFRFKVAATDPAGVSTIGVHIAQEVDARRIFKKYWGKAERKDAQGRFEMSAGVVAHVPPGQRLELAVYELCARDSLGNEGCSLPHKLNSLNFNARK